MSETEAIGGDLDWQLFVKQIGGLKSHFLATERLAINKY